MKLSIALLTAAVAVSAAQPHQHRHQHLHKAKRDALADPELVVVPGPTMIAYVLNGLPISEEDVKEGIANGTLILAGNGQLSSASVASSALETAKPSLTTLNTPTTRPFSSTSTASSVEAASSSISLADKSTSKNTNVDISSASGVDTPFPDGEIDCSTFPSEYGAVPVSYLGLGGWTGIQQGGAGSSLLSGLMNILTVTTGTCIGGHCCTEGSYCSYACPAGYQKSQWPTTQGATGQSVGGILCQNGKLKLTNPSMANTLCMTGTDKVNVLVENTLGDDVAVCRTDYPGTESETVPLAAAAGTTNNLTCPDADNYYNWEGGHTSAQYYVNPAGVSVEDGCQWGSSAKPWGNFAPLNLGVGYSAGAAWLSIFQNAPTTDEKLDFTVEIQGDNMSGTCRYSNGQYCSGEDYSNCSPTTGCTVSVSSGTAKFVFSK
nr:secreted beta-glucosidase sun1 [Quercus suber]